jgi:hypothetical protein
MANENLADQEVGVVVDKLPDVLNATVKVEGTLTKVDKNSLLGIRVDYQVNGNYVSSVLFHGAYKGVDLFDRKRDALMPWGTKKQADKLIAVNDLSGFRISLKENAPAGWTGKAHITYIMQNTGVATRAKITLR